MEQKVIKQEQKKVLLLPKRVKMRIALCEKEKCIKEKIKKFIYNFAEIHRLDIVVECFSNSEALLCSDKQYNLIFIGKTLDCKCGLDTAKLIRTSNSFSSIVFINQNTDIVLEAFKVDTYRFLLSPVNEIEIHNVLSDYFLEFGNDYPLWIKSAEEIYCLNSRDIYFLEADNKHCFVHLKKETLPCNKTMAKISEILPKTHFIKINRAFIVNVNHIIKYNNDNVYLKNGEKVHISRNYLKFFKENYKSLVNPRLP